MFEKILIAFDGSEPSRHALERAVQLAAQHGSSLTAIAVEEHLPHYAATVGETVEAKEQLDAYFAGIMEQARSTARQSGIALECRIAAGDAAQQIMSAAREIAADLIVLGPHGHSAIRDYLLGTTTDRVTHHAPCSVLVVR